MGTLAHLCCHDFSGKARSLAQPVPVSHTRDRLPGYHTNLIVPTGHEVPFSFTVACMHACAGVERAGTGPTLPGAAARPCALTCSRKTPRQRTGQLARTDETHAHTRGSPVPGKRGLGDAARERVSRGRLHGPLAEGVGLEELPGRVRGDGAEEQHSPTQLQRLGGAGPAHATWPGRKTNLLPRELVKGQSATGS